VTRVLGYIKHWPIYRKMAAVISKTPDGKCYDHSAYTRNPLHKWVSEKGRMIVIGDAAHPMLPTVSQGASQGMMDAAVLAICLELAGKRNVPLALQVMETLR
jgi:2-polyprenyl-6-methoxyphenol hydroxylase-like FAD-dependent oxidoreductase